ncbi:hypothetical protein E2542_SST12568 [Spatholobus suberectus]|nr:hypothetical protein E2542_SST12568 [Spatholobus suberectus]
MFPCARASPLRCESSRIYHREPSHFPNQPLPYTYHAAAILNSFIDRLKPSTATVASATSKREVPPSAQLIPKPAPPPCASIVPPTPDEVAPPHEPSRLRFPVARGHAFVSSFTKPLPVVPLLLALLPPLFSLQRRHIALTRL